MKDESKLGSTYNCTKVSRRNKSEVEYSQICLIG
jgi:hypothetical protein